MGFFRNVTDFITDNFSSYKPYYKGKYKKVFRNGKYVYEHRYIAEQMNGGPLRRDQHVHHKDRNTYNNKRNNLEILSPYEHAKKHGFFWFKK